MSMLRMVAKGARLCAYADYWVGLLHGVGAGIEHHAFLQTKSWASIFDVGANKGQFSLAAHRHHQSATVVAFEPLPAPFSIYKKIFKDVPMVSVHNFALGDVDTSAPMHISAREDSSSLLPIGDDQVEVFPGTEETGVVEVEVRRLDTVVSAIVGPALLKIDVQGFELGVLKGAAGILSQIDDIYVEVSWRELYRGQPTFIDVKHWLDLHGFEFIWKYNATTDLSGNVVQADCHFARRHAK